MEGKTLLLFIRMSCSVPISFRDAVLAELSDLSFLHSLLYFAGCDKIRSTVVKRTVFVPFSGSISAFVYPVFTDPMTNQVSRDLIGSDFGSAELRLLRKKCIT